MLFNNNVYLFESQIVSKGFKFIEFKFLVLAFGSIKFLNLLNFLFILAFCNFEVRLVIHKIVFFLSKHQINQSF